MKVVYTIPVRTEAAIPVSSVTSEMTIGTTIVRWNVDKNDQLKEIGLEFTGVDIQYTEDGAISLAYPELEKEAYRLALYLANRVLIETKWDALEPKSVLRKSPSVFPENSQEKNGLRSRGKRCWVTAPMEIHVWVPFDPISFSTGITCSEAYGYYADALRTPSIFQQFEMLFKVVEYFFECRGSQLDTAVSAYITQHDPTYTCSAVEELRVLRNRIVHPRANKGHVNPHNIVDVREVSSELPRMQRLARLLLENPTF